MKVSIIIVSWNVRDLLKKCIESIFVFSKNTEFEIIVVDNASSDGTGEMIQKNFPEVCFIQNNQNLGFSKANNIGIEKAKGEYILLLNPDTEFVEDSLSLVVKKMEADKKIGVLGCKLINHDKTTQESVRRFPRIVDIGVIFFKIYKIFPFLLNRYLEKDFDYSKDQNVDQVMGAFFFVRGEVFDKIGLLDEKYFIWFEEVDFCLRAKKSGWNILYFPQTCVIHYGGKSFEQAKTAKKQMWFFKSSMRYLLKSKIM